MPRKIFSFYNHQQVRIPTRHAEASLEDSNRSWGRNKNKVVRGQGSYSDYSGVTALQPFFKAPTANRNVGPGSNTGKF